MILDKLLSPPKPHLCQKTKRTIWKWGLILNDLVWKPLSSKLRANKTLYLLPKRQKVEQSTLEFNSLCQLILADTYKVRQIKCVEVYWISKSTFCVLVYLPIENNKFLTLSASGHPQIYHTINFIAVFSS